MREWLSAQAASGYLTYDAATGAFTLPPEQAMAFAREDSPVYLAGGYRLISSVFKDRQKITERIRGGEGFGWHEHDPELFAGTEQFFRPGYRATRRRVAARARRCRATSSPPEPRWPTSAADTVCRPRHGAGVPESTVHGFDFHDASIERARDGGGRGVDNAEFAVATARATPATYDLVCFFDCLHDMGDPVGALRMRAKRWPTTAP